MMRRHWTHRLSAVLFAVWFGIVGLEPAALGVCPMHNPTAGATATMADAHAGHASHVMGGEHAPADHHAHHCTCPGSCCSVAVLSVPVAGSHAVFVAQIATERPSPTLPTLANWTDFVLPFATAPPSATTA
jgi:hypothetical protein